jgi:septal ring factor EnvC (AmiA/AmiB activator)
MEKADFKKPKARLVRNHEQTVVALPDNALMDKKVKKDSVTAVKHTIYLGKTIVAALAIFASLFFMSCNSPAEKVGNAKDNVMQAEENLKIAEQEYAAEVELFRTESDKEISELEKEIAEINTKIKNSSKALRAKYEKEILALEQKNIEMRKKIVDYKADKREDWASFKAEFSKDMNELGQALKDFKIDE